MYLDYVYTFTFGLNAKLICFSWERKFQCVPWLKRTKTWLPKKPFNISKKGNSVNDTKMKELSLICEFKGRSFQCTNRTLFESIVFSRASGEVFVRINDKLLFNSCPNVFFALWTEDVEKNMAVVCSSTVDTPSLVLLVKLCWMNRRMTFSRTGF